MKKQETKKKKKTKTNKQTLPRDLHKYFVLQNEGKKQEFAKKIDETTGKRWTNRIWRELGRGS